MNSQLNPPAWITQYNFIKNNFIKTALVAACLIFTSAGQANAQIYETSEVSSGWVQSLEQAIAESESSGKPIMFVFSGSDWCSYCQRLEQEVFQTHEFESWSSQNVVKVLVDFPMHHQLTASIAKQNEDLKEYFAGQLRGYPTILIVQTDGTVLGRSGYVAGGPIPWISKTDPILRRSQQRLADTSYQSH